MGRRDVDWHAARTIAADALALVPAECALTGAADAVLAADLRATSPLPPVDTAAMDGFAVAGDGPWRCVGVVPAGRLWDDELVAGDAVEIATGAAVPSGAYAVLRHEDATVSHDGRLHGTIRAGRHIRSAAADIAVGDLLMPAGRRVGPLLLGLAAAAGFDSLLVHPRPRVTLIVTGAEIRRDGPNSGTAVRDALGPALPGMLSGLGGDVVAVVHVGDDPDALLYALDDDADVHVVTGGSALGPVDRLHKTLADLGCELLIDGVRCRPGRPQVLGRRADGRHVVGLPGNPSAAVAATMTLLAPLLSALGGAVPPDELRISAPPGLPSVADGVTLLAPAVLGFGEVTVLPPTSSASLRSTALATHLLVVEDDASTVVALPLPTGTR